MRILKTTLCWVLLCCIIFSLAACGKPADSTDGSSATNGADAAPDYSKQTALVNTEGMTDLQKAIVVTAESYYLRGNYAQYDMGTLVNPQQTDKVERRITGFKAPEDYTRQHTGYNDCSGFVYDVYKTALGMTISASTPWTKTYTTSSYVILKETPAPKLWSPW